MEKTITVGEIEQFVSDLQKIMPESRGEVTFSTGRKYFKIISYGSVWGFVDFDGNVLKAAGWRGPAKGIRGNITDPEIISKVDWTGPRYLR